MKALKWTKFDVIRRKEVFQRWLWLLPSCTEFLPLIQPPCLLFFSTSSYFSSLGSLYAFIFSSPSFALVYFKYTKQLLLTFPHCTETAKHRSLDVVKQPPPPACHQQRPLSRRAAIIVFHTVSTNLLLSYIGTFPCINSRRMGTTKKALPHLAISEAVTHLGTITIWSPGMGASLKWGV